MKGTARALAIQKGQPVLRIEESDVLELDPRVTTGLDLHLNFATEKQAFAFVDLGKRKKNNSNQNYDLPRATDLSKSCTVLVSVMQ